MANDNDDFRGDELILHLATWKIGSSTDQKVVLCLEYKDSIGQPVALPVCVMPTDVAERFARDILKVCNETRMRTARARRAH